MGVPPREIERNAAMMAPIGPHRTTDGKLGLKKKKRGRVTVLVQYSMSDGIIMSHL